MTNTAVRRIKSIGTAKRIRVRTYARSDPSRAMRHPPETGWRQPIKTLRKGEGARASTVPGNGHQLSCDLDRVADLRKQRVRGSALRVPISGLEHGRGIRQLRGDHAVQRRDLAEEDERVDCAPVDRVRDRLPHPLGRNQVHIEHQEPNLRARPAFQHEAEAGLAGLEIREVDRRNRPERDIDRLRLNVLLEGGDRALDVDYDTIHLRY